MALTQRRQRRAHARFALIRKWPATKGAAARMTRRISIASWSSLIRKRKNDGRGSQAARRYVSKSRNQANGSAALGAQASPPARSALRRATGAQARCLRSQMQAGCLRSQGRLSFLQYVATQHEDYSEAFVH